MLKIEDMTQEKYGTARYSDLLEMAVHQLEGKEVLFIQSEAGYSGDVDIDVLLEDGRVYSYHYYFGSCSGCDEWESRDLSDSEIIEIMCKEATFFDDLEQYKKWAEKGRKEGER